MYFNCLIRESSSLVGWPGNHSTENVLAIAGNGLRLLGNGRDSEQLSAGRHQFPFSFRLPRSLPSSLYTGRIHHPLGSGYCEGRIRYLLIANLSRPWKSKRYISKTVTVQDIVRIPMAVSSSHWKAVERTCGPVRVWVKTDRGGYYPGESITLTVKVKNNGYGRINAVQARLMQSVIYRGRDRGEVEEEVEDEVTPSCNPIGSSGFNGRRRDRRVTLRHSDRQRISFLNGPGVEPRGEINWNDKMSIPLDTVPNISNCRVISLSYILLVQTVGTGLSVEVPIIIGSKSFREHTTMDSTNAYQPLATNSGSRPVQMEQFSTNTFPPSVRNPSSQREQCLPSSHSGMRALPSPFNPQFQERLPGTITQPAATNTGLVSFSHSGSSIPQTSATYLEFMSFQGEQVAAATSNSTHQTANTNAEAECPQLNTGDDQGMREAVFAPVSDSDANCNSDQPPPYDSLVIGEYAYGYTHT